MLQTVSVAIVPLTSPAKHLELKADSKRTVAICRPQTRKERLLQMTMPCSSLQLAVQTDAGKSGLTLHKPEMPEPAAWRLNSFLQKPAPNPRNEGVLSIPPVRSRRAPNGGRSIQQVH